LEDAVRTTFAAWETFYVIIGSSAAALTGLQFVVIAVIRETRRRATASEINAFGTPTVVHFSLALMVSAILSAPWPTLPAAAVAVACCGIGGFVYTLIILRRARRQTTYTPVLEDWIFHIVLPLVAYVTLIAASASLPRAAADALFAIGAATLLLLFIGIHNAWDTITHLTLRRIQREQEKPDK